MKKVMNVFAVVLILICVSAYGFRLYVEKTTSAYLSALTETRKRLDEKHSMEMASWVQFGIFGPTEWTSRTWIWPDKKHNNTVNWKAVQIALASNKPETIPGFVSWTPSNRELFTKIEGDIAENTALQKTLVDFFGEMDSSPNAKPINKKLTIKNTKNQNLAIINDGDFFLFKYAAEKNGLDVVMTTSSSRGDDIIVRLPENRQTLLPIPPATIFLLVIALMTLFIRWRNFTSKDYNGILAEEAGISLDGPNSDARN